MLHPLKGNLFFTWTNPVFVSINWGISLGRLPQVVFHYKYTEKQHCAFYGGLLLG